MGMKKNSEVSPLSLWYSLVDNDFVWGLSLSCIISFLLDVLKTLILVEFSSINFIFELIINCNYPFYSIANVENPYNFLLFTKSAFSLITATPSNNCLSNRNVVWFFKITLQNTLFNMFCNSRVYLNSFC